MKILARDLQKGVLQLKVEAFLDLILLYRLLSPGDKVHGRTTREIKKLRPNGKYDSERIPVSVQIEVEKKGVDAVLKQLSFLGRISFASRRELIGKYHSIKVGLGSVVLVEKKRLRRRHLSLISRLAEGQSRNLICLLIDDVSYLLAELNEGGTRVVEARRIPYGGKGDPAEYIRERAKLLERASSALEEGALDSSADVVVLGPSIFVSDFLSHLKRNSPATHERVKKTAYVSSTTTAGLDEALRNRLLTEYSEEVKPVKDADLVEKLIERLASWKKDVSIGLDEVLYAAEAKAISRLLVEENYLWQNLEKEPMLQLLELVEKTRGEIVIISRGTEAGAKLSSFGGVAALLRYSLRSIG